MKTVTSVPLTDLRLQATQNRESGVANDVKQELEKMQEASIPHIPNYRQHSSRWISTSRFLSTFILRYGLVVVLLLWGTAKWTKDEALAIQPLVAHSPLLSWIYRITSVQHGSELIGIAELALAVLIALRRWSPQASAVGSTASILMFLTTLTFLVTTPGLDGLTQGFLIKDIFLLGAAVFTAGEAWEAALKHTKVVCAC